MRKNNDTDLSTSIDQSTRETATDKGWLLVVLCNLIQGELNIEYPDQYKLNRIWLKMSKHFP